MTLLTSRRKLLQIGGMGMLGLTLPKLLAGAEQGRSIAPRAKSVIFLFQWGGPSHIDMFDLKPDAPDKIRGPYKPIPSAILGSPVGEKLPKVAQIMDRVTLIRSVHHRMNNHNSAGYYALSGHAPPSDDQRLRDSLDLFPMYGSVVDRLSPGDPQLPTSVAYPYVIRDGSVTPGQHASFLGKAHDPFLFTEDPNSPNFRLPELSLPEGLSVERLQRRRELQRLVDSQVRLQEAAAEVRGLDAYFDKALTMLTSPRVKQAFDLSAETEETRERYGRTSYGQSCLLARRLVEGGVKFVTVYFSDTIGGQSTTSGGWDTHGFNNTRMFPIVEKRHFPITEQTLPTLLIDLEERGLLDETLVVWMGEFGRMPKINGNESRDHWPFCYSVLLAGGGVKRGFVYGASDAYGQYPDQHPLKPDDIAATMYHLLGIPHDTEVHDAANRPLPISYGRPVLEVMA